MFTYLLWAKPDCRESGHDASLEGIRNKKDVLADNRVCEGYVDKAAHPGAYKSRNCNYIDREANRRVA